MDYIAENGTTSSYISKDEIKEEKDDDSDVEYLEIKDMETKFSTGGNSFKNMFVDVSEVVHSSEDELIEEDPLSEKRIINDTDCTKKNLQQLPPCKNGCHLKITDEDRKKTFFAYSKKTGFRSRFNFVTDMTVMVPMMVHDKKSPGTFKKIYNTTFYIRSIEGTKKVCKACLTLILKENDNFISTVLVKKFLKMNKMLQSNQDSKGNQGILQKTNEVEISNMDLKLVPERKIFSAHPYLIRDIKLAKGYTRIPPCKYKCYMKISKNDQRSIYESYWEGATFHSRLNFIKYMTEVSKRIYPDQIDRHGNPEYIANYYLRAKKGLQRVCRTCFRIALNEMDKFITEVLEEKLRQSSRLAEFEEPKPLDQNAQLLDIQCKIEGEPFDISDDGMRLIWNPLQHCKDECYLKVTEADQIRTFDVYRRALTLFERYNFLKEMTDMIPSKQPDVENSGKIMKDSAVYYINTKKGRTRVCKSCFCQTINEADFLVEAVLDEKCQVTDLNQPNDAVALQLEDLIRKPIIEVEKHIKKFPLSEIHDFSAQDTEKYLPMGLSLGIMYYLYVKEVFDPVSIDDYHEILNLMNLKFQSDVETYKSPKNPKEKLRLNYHVVAFESAQKLKSMDEIKAQFANKSLVLCLIGFRRSLPTPWLNDPASFYKRPLWIHNLTIRQNSGSYLGRPKFYMWDETQGKQTTNEIASCLYQYLLDLPPTVKTVIVCSNCGQESRSKSLSMMFSYLMAHHKTLEVIEHKFLTSAPFHSDDNLDNLLTEKMVKKHQGRIEHPKDWYNAFSKPRKSKDKPEVVIMTSEKFYDFESHWKDPLEEDEPYVDKEVKWLRYTKEGVACCKNSCNQSYRFKVADLKLKSQCESVWNAALNNLGEVPLSKERKNDLLDLLPLMSPNVASFYEGLPVENDMGLAISMNNFEEKRESSKLKKDSKFRLKKNCLLKNINIPKKASNVKSKVNFESNDQEFEREREDERNKDNLADECVDLSDMIEILGEKVIEGSNPRKYPKAEKSWEALPPCDEECHLKIPQADQRRIFDMYSQMKLFESKIDFVSAMIKINSITPEENAALNMYYTTYLVNTEEGSQNICRKCFVFIIGERDYFITKVLEEKFQEMDESKDLAEENPKTSPETQECEIIDETHSSISNDDIIIERVVEKTLPKLYEFKESEEESQQLEENYQPAEIYENSIDELINEPSSNFDHLTSKSEVENLTGSRKSHSSLVKKVKNHINKFPLTEQGFAKYLPIGLTPEVMYDLYAKEVSNPVSINFYKKVLLAHTDLKLKPLILGECVSCSTALEMLKTLDDPSERYKIDSFRTDHLSDAVKSNRSKLRDEEKARKNSDVHVCSFSFQSILPTPCLNESIAYYQHPLWTYNLIIEQQIIDRTLPEKKTYSYMWHEGDGKGTANEIASCLYQYLKNLPPSVKYVIIYSTACDGEARSKTLSMMFSHFISNHKTIKSVDHKFFVSGHSGFEERLDNEWIELMNNHRGKIEVPDDWYQAASSKKQYLVIMNPEKFYDFESLWKDNGVKPFIDKTVKWLRYVKPGVVYSKNSWRSQDPFNLLNLNSKFEDVSKVGLCKLGAFPITEKKKNGLLSLLPLMGLKARCFYERLPDEKILSQKSKGKSASKRKRNLGKTLPISSSIVTEVHLENGDLDYMEEESDEPPIKISNKRDFIQLDAVSVKKKWNERSSISCHSLSKFLK